MAKSFLLLLALMTLLINSSFKPNYISSISNKCDVAKFFEAIEPTDGVKVITGMGELVEAEIILVPTELEEGVYEIKISRKGNNIYKIEGTKYYIETRFCFEFVFIGDAILKVERKHGYTLGALYFE